MTKSKSKPRNKKTSNQKIETTKEIDITTAPDNTIATTQDSDIETLGTIIVIRQEIDIRTTREIVTDKTRGIGLGICMMGRERKTRKIKKIGKRISRSTRRKTKMMDIRKVGEDRRVDRVRREDIRREEDILQPHLPHLNLPAEVRVHNFPHQTKCNQIPLWVWGKSKDRMRDKT